MPRILIIDDEEDIRELVAMMLDSVGHTVLTAGNGATGLSLLASQEIDLVILDVMMPDMSGWDVCRHIKNDPANGHIPVIIFTVRGMLQDREVMAEARPDGFLNKPFEHSDLLEQVTRLLTPAGNTV